MNVRMTTAKPKARTGVCPPVRLMVSAIAVSVMLAMPAIALAETLQEALTLTYQSNPRLDAERARLRATDEGVPQAKAGYRPTATATGQTGFQRQISNPAQLTDGQLRTSGIGVTVTQPIFTGFRTVNTVAEAEANVRAGRATRPARRTGRAAGASGLRRADRAVCRGRPATPSGDRGAPQLPVLRRRSRGVQRRADEPDVAVCERSGQRVLQCVVGCRALANAGRVDALPHQRLPLADARRWRLGRQWKYAGIGDGRHAGEDSGARDGPRGGRV